MDHTLNKTTRPNRDQKDSKGKQKLPGIFEQIERLLEGSFQNSHKETKQRLKHMYE